MKYPKLSKPYYSFSLLLLAYSNSDTPGFSIALDLDNSFV